jgi:SAM-dependent methyltransferase
MSVSHGLRPSFTTVPLIAAMSSPSFEKHDPALTAVERDAAAICVARLARVAGTHALLLDGAMGSTPSVAGLACWTVLRPGEHGECWQGALRTAIDALPFGDDSFCAVLVRFVDQAGMMPEAVAGELARVLAPHGVLLVADIHPHSLWPAGTKPGRWERALREQGLEVAATVRCGAPWPRPHGETGLPHWLVRSVGGGYVIEARRRTLSGITLRKSGSTRRAVEHQPILPGAHRQRA